MHSSHRSSLIARARALTFSVVALVATHAAVAGAQPRQSGVQLTPDLQSVLVSKDVGTERWAIALNADGTATGNVFRQDGAPPSFLWCEELTDRRTDTELTLSCYAASACAAAPCDAGDWQFVADVTLPTAFFEPPASSPSPSPSTTPSPTRTPSPTTTSSPSPATPSPATPSPATPSPATPTPSTPSPTVTSSPGDDDIRCCVADDDGPECEDRTPSECAARGGTNLGPGSCEPDPCG